MSRFGYAMATCFATMGVASGAFVPMPPKLVWNASASAPIGFYAIGLAERLEIGDLVAVDVPEPLATLSAERGYLPRGTPLMKRVAAVAGQRVCRMGRTISVDAIDVAEALDSDRLGRAMPGWQGCRVITAGEVFLMNAQIHDSFDGRYFGPIPTSSIIGRATPLYTDQDGSGRFEGRSLGR